MTNALAITLTAESGRDDVTHYADKKRT